MTNIAEIAERLDRAAAESRAIAQISQGGSDISLDEAYAIQAAAIGRRLERGERMVGVKMGFTSEAKMIQMGLKDQIWGRLTDAMQAEAGSALDRARFIHPRVEPEVAVRLAKPLCGEVDLDTARQAVAAVAPALEIIDSRYENFKFALSDVVADNASSSAFVVGKWLPDDTEIGDVAMAMAVDGEVVERGSSTAILGNPLRSLVAAARLAGAAGLTLEAGWIVLLGGATAAAAIGTAKEVSLDAGSLGTVGFRIEGA
jgi:2-oxo-3-hexenedioate decarboxylase